VGVAASQLLICFWQHAAVASNNPKAQQPNNGNTTLVPTDQ